MIEEEESEGSVVGLLGGMVLGGALTWLFGGGKQEEFLEDEVEWDDLGSLTGEEREFLSQLWRLEFQLEEAVKEEEWERAVVLLNVFEGCLRKAWTRFVPGNDAFTPSPKYLHEIEDLIGPSLKRFESAINLDPFAKLSPKRRSELNGRQLSIDLDEWEFVFK